MITLSLEQLHVISTLQSTSDNLLISACAGGAKTTTLLECCRVLGPGRRIVFLAFNKDIAEELKARVPYFVTASTFHGFCYDALGKHIGRKPRPDGNRTKWMLKDMVPDWKARRAVEEATLTLVSRAKSSGYACGLPSDPDLHEIADRFNIEINTDVFNYATEILNRCADNKAPSSIDFDDMLWLTLLWNVPFTPVAYILLDEAQDTNGVQRALLARMLDAKGERPCTSYAGFAEPHNDIDACTICGQKKAQHPRLIAVGDPHQSIYGFRGADSDAMAALARDFNMTELSLSVSYRCSQAVVAEAQKYL